MTATHARRRAGRSQGKRCISLTSQSFADGEQVEIIATAPPRSYEANYAIAAWLLSRSGDVCPWRSSYRWYPASGAALRSRAAQEHWPRRLPTFPRPGRRAPISPGRKSCGHSSGKSIVWVDQNQKRLAETRLQFANMAHGLKTPVTSLYLTLNDNADPTGGRLQVGWIDRRIKHHLGRARAGVSAAGLAPPLSSARISMIS